MGKHRIFNEGRQVGSRPQDHDAQLLVPQVLLGGCYGNTDLNVCFHHRDLTHLFVHMHLCDVGEVAGVVASARDKSRGRISPTRYENVPGMNPYTENLRGRGRRRFVTAFHECLDLVGMLQHYLFESSSPSVE